MKWVNGGFSGSEDALVGGHDVGGETLYIGRAGKFGNLIPGKVVPSHKACYVAHEGREDRYIIYEVSSMAILQLKKHSSANPDV